MLGETREGIGAQTDLLIYCLRALGLSATPPRSKRYTNAPDWHTPRLLGPALVICRLGRRTQPAVQSRGRPDSHSRRWRPRQSPAQWPPRSLANDLRSIVSGSHARPAAEPLRR